MITKTLINSLIIKGFKDC